MIGWSREIDELGWSAWEPPAADGPDLERVRDQLAREMARSHGHGWNLVDVRIGKRRQSRRGMTALYTLVFDGGPVEHVGKVGENGTDGQIEQVYVGCELSPGALDTAYTSALA